MSVTVDHVNVRCLLDGRKFRISARNSTAVDYHMNLGDLTVGTLHRRLADQTGFDERSFALHLSGPKASPTANEGRALASTEVLRDIAYWSHTSQRHSVVIEMKAWTSLLPPKSFDSARRPPPPTPPAVSPALSRSTSVSHAKSNQTSVETHRDSSGLLDELQYQLEVAQELLAVDRRHWAEELSALESKLSRDVRVASTHVDPLELELEVANAKLRDDVYALTEQLDLKRAASRAILLERDSARSQVDTLAAKIDDQKQAILNALAQSSASEAKDFDVIERLVSLVSQRHLHLIEAQIEAEGLESISSDLERAKYQRRTLHNSVEEAKGNIRVVVRMRPTLETDFAAPYHPVRDEEGALLINEKENTVRFASPTTGTHDYEFFKVYGPPAEDTEAAQQQQLIFLEQVQPLLQSLFDGKNVSVMAYGQTGSGKTHTIFGRETAGGQDSSPLDGVLPQAVEHLFRLREQFTTSHPKSTIRFALSMVEVYMNDVYDVLAPLSVSEQPQWGNSGSTRLAPHLTKCDVKATAEGAAVVGATLVECTNLEDAIEALQRGFSNRTTHATLTNSRSSRSHLLLTFQVVRNAPGEPTAKSELMFTDLAGSERVHRSLSAGDRLKEAQHINRSLSALGDVLAALTKNGGKSAAAHVPYRNARLTHLLQRCVGGDCRTLLVACICPHVPQRHNLGETASTLAFAARARLVKNQGMR